MKYIKSAEAVKNNIKYSLFPGLICAFFVVAGYSVKHNRELKFSTLGVLCFALVAILLTAFIAFVFCLYDKARSNKNGSWFNKAITKSWVFFFLSLLFLFFMWTPVFLAFYPGLFVYDAQWQYLMYVNKAVTTHHPVIHTYMLGSIIDTVYGLTGSINKGIAAYTLAQEILMAFGASYILYLLHRRKASTWLLVLSLVLFCVYPPFLIMVFSSTKDALFAVVVADFILLTLDLLDDRERFFLNKVNSLMWILLLFLTVSLRSNAIYAILCVAPFWIVHIFSRKVYRRNMLCMLGIAVLVLIIYRYPITEAITVEGTSKAEMLSVPCQQLMRVYKYHFDELTKIEKNDISKFFDSEKWYGFYVPEIADASKGSLRMDLYEANKKEFYNTWLKFFKKYPSEYLDSFLENTYGFWYPWPRYVIYSFGDEGYTPMVSMQPAEMNVKLPFLYNILSEFENGDIVQKNIFISWIFAPATFFYFVLINFFYMIKTKEKKLYLPFLFIIILWCTFLLGPAAMMRYAFYLYVLVPIWLAYVHVGVKDSEI